MKLLFAFVLLFVICYAHQDDQDDCFRGQGYWKNHLEEWTDYHNNTIECCYSGDNCVFREYKDIMTFHKNQGWDWDWLRISRHFTTFLLNNLTYQDCEYDNDYVDEMVQLLNASCTISRTNRKRALELKDYFEDDVSCNCTDCGNSTNSTSSCNSASMSSYSITMFFFIMLFGTFF